MLLFDRGRKYTVNEVSLPGVPKPLTPQDIPPYLAWRIAVTLSITGLFGFVLWTIGAFAFMGFPGFARADKLDVVIANQEADRSSRLETEIRDLQKQYCTTTDTTASDYWARERDRKRREYYDLTRREYPLPTCVQAGSR